MKTKIINLDSVELTEENKKMIEDNLLETRDLQEQDYLEDIKQEEVEKEIAEKMNNEEKANIEALEELEEEVEKELLEKQNNCEHEFQIEVIEQNSPSYLLCDVVCQKCQSKFSGVLFKK